MKSCHDMYSILASAFLIIAGWIVVHECTKKREKDKAKRDLIFKIIENLDNKIDALSDLSYCYHSKNRDLNLEAKIKTTIQEISLRLTSLENLTKSKKVWANSLTKMVLLRQAITGRHFEDEHTDALPENEHSLNQISSASIDLKIVISQLSHLELI